MGPHTSLWVVEKNLQQTNLLWMVFLMALWPLLGPCGAHVVPMLMGPCWAILGQDSFEVMSSNLCMTSAP